MRALALLVVAAAACDTPPSYVEPRTCATCHPDETRRWRGSHHDRAMGVASPGAVAGDFAGAALDGVRFERDGDGFAIDADHRRHRVRFTFGVEPVQQYLVDGPGGRLEVSPYGWDTARRAWYRVTPADLPARYRTWNTMCAECHSTAVAKGYDAAADRFATRWADLDVGCQACHGPGSRHAADPTERLPASRAPEACAPCHARRSAIAATGATFLDRYRPVTLGAGLYYPDGQILDEVFEYGSFAQSAMHERGVTCVDCHDPHGGRTPGGNATCTQCHSAAPPARFPGLARRATDVDTPAHHHHRTDSPGARCVACHMPTRTYMGVDVRHDHGFQIPRPDLAAALDTPDPCTRSCHAGRDARWAAATVAAWFPGSKPAHPGEVIARARRGEAAPEELATLATGDRPAIVRATALELLAGAPAGCLAAAPRGLADPSPLVRSIAVTCGEPLAPAARAALAGPALRDPVRLVRIEAARVLAGAPLRDADRAAFEAARRELEDAYRMDLDRPEGWFNLAGLAEAEGRRTEALADLREALVRDPDYRPAQQALAALAR